MINIPEDYVELEQIYCATLAADIKSLAVVSTTPGEGVSSIIVALAKRNVLAGRKTLVVDLNIYNPALSALTRSSHQPCSSKTLSPPTPLALSQIHNNIAVVTVPRKRALVLALREPGVLQSHITQWLKDYDNVLFDTSPMSLTNGANLPPEYIASACDGAILSVLATKTTNTALLNTITKLNQAKALLVGIVINDQFNPSLKEELLREVGRIEKYLPTIAGKLNYWIKHSKILALAL